LYFTNKRELLPETLRNITPHGNHFFISIYLSSYLSLSLIFLVGFTDMYFRDCFAFK